MAQSNKERTIVIVVITVNAVISVLLIITLVYLFTQVTHLQGENNHLRNQWHKLQASHEANGQMNAEGKKTTNGNEYKRSEKCCGVKGKRGRPGIKGDRGEKGDVGRDGQTGLPGQDGKPGKNGQKGEKGDQGVCSGSCTDNLMTSKKDYPLVYLTGDGRQSKKISNIESNAVPFWKLANITGDITYRKGHVTINVEGFYYIYSQMAYCGKNEFRVGHYMLNNNKKILKTKVTAKVYGTHSTGSVFKLYKGDKITISPVVTNVEYCFGQNEAFFGAFLIRE